MHSAKAGMESARANPETNQSAKKIERSQKERKRKERKKEKKHGTRKKVSKEKKTEEGRSKEKKKRHLDLEDAHFNSFFPLSLRFDSCRR